MRHPAELGPDDIVGSVSWLAGESRVSAATQTQATSALLFLYREVLQRDIGRWVYAAASAAPYRQVQDWFSTLAIEYQLGSVKAIFYPGWQCVGFDTVSR